MPGIYAKVAVIDKGRILLVQREDFKTWGLPGGHVEDGESVAQAAVREILEETGLEVELTRLVGIYVRPRWPEDNHGVVFAATPVGGSLQLQQSEVVNLRYFLPHELPERLLWWHLQPIQDALNGVGGGVVWSQNVTWPFQDGMTRQQMYEQRERDELPLQQLYNAWCRKPRPGDQVREVGEG